MLIEIPEYAVNEALKWIESGEDKKAPVLVGDFLITFFVRPIALKVENRKEGRLLPRQGGDKITINKPPMYSLEVDVIRK